ncbi:MAG: lipid-A-disaccharide synthase, partial [Armatimonadota bacterium]
MTSHIKKITIIAGEASGDLHGACLAAGLKSVLPDADIQGIGSRRMREAGVRLLYDSSSWSAIGIAEALKLVPRLLITLKKLQKRLRRNPQDLIILIDFGAFNVRVCRSLQSTGTKVLYYFPPGSWNRNAVYDHLRGCVDKIVTPFPWSEDLLRKQGFDADFFGHPLLDVTKPTLSKEEFYARFKLDPERPVIGLLPGSRTHEIKHHVPVMTVAASLLQKSVPGLQFVIPVAPSVSVDGLARELGGIPWVDVESYVRNESGAFLIGGKSELGIRNHIYNLLNGYHPNEAIHIKLVPGMTTDLLAHSRAAMISSGTATIEAAVLGCPMVIIYKVSGIASLEFKLRGKKIKYIGMPNIVADKLICPELILDNVTPENISNHMAQLVQKSTARS